MTQRLPVLVSRRGACGMIASAAALASFPGHAQTPVRTTSTIPDVTPRIEAVEDLSSSAGLVYRIFTSVPTSQPPLGGFPVLYVLDGNAWFDLTGAIARLNLPDAIVVGVGYPTGALLDFARRSDDLVPFPAANGNPPQADRFFSFLTQELMPHVAAKYPVGQRQRTLIGHSLGGLFTLYALFTKPVSFSTYVALSPSIWRSDRRILAAEEAFYAHSPTGIRPRVFVSAGEYEQFPNKAYLELLAHRYADRPEYLGGQSVEEAVTDYRRRAPEARMVENARELSERLAQHGISVRFELIPSQDHMSALPAALGHAVPYALERID